MHAGDTVSHDGRHVSAHALILEQGLVVLITVAVVIAVVIAVIVTVVVTIHVPIKIAVPLFAPIIIHPLIELRPACAVVVLDVVDNLPTFLLSARRTLRPDVTFGVAATTTSITTISSSAAQHRVTWG